MLHIALVDDDARELERTGTLVERWQDAPSRFAAFSSARALLAAMDAGADFDLYLLDVVMPEMDGIELGRAIRERDKDGAIIFLTTSPDFALDSYEVWPLQYLLKPVDAARLALTRTPCATLRAAWLRHYLKGGGEA